MTGAVLFVAGVVAGVFLGVLILALCVGSAIDDERRRRENLSRQLAERDRSLAFAALSIAGVNDTTVEEALLLLESYGKEEE